MSGLSTHILDTTRGVPASGVPVTLEARGVGGSGGAWSAVHTATTDADGRVKSLIPAGRTWTAGVYRLRFDTAAYFRTLGAATFYPLVEITFEVADASRHHHVPLLLSPFGYTTYRGS